MKSLYEDFPTASCSAWMSRMHRGTTRKITPGASIDFVNFSGS